jgi:hypothetical protein
VGPGPRRHLEWRYAPLGRAPSLRDARAAQLWFPEWQTSPAWTAARRRLWGLDPAARNPPLASSGLLPAQLPVMPGTAAAAAAASAPKL